MHCKISVWLGILFIILRGVKPGMSGSCNKPIEKNIASLPSKTSQKQYLTFGITFSRFGGIPVKELGNLGAEFGSLSSHFSTCCLLSIQLSYLWLLFCKCAFIQYVKGEGKPQTIPFSLQFSH